MVKRFIFKKTKDNISPRRLAMLKNHSQSEVIEEMPIVEEVLPEIEEVVEQEVFNEEHIEVVENEEIIENKEELKEDNVMDTKEKIQMANAILNVEQPKVKKVKKDKGLIERTESSITILTEDNRELLKD
jgi:hypothetical protein